MSYDVFQEKRTEWLDELGDDKKSDIIIRQALCIYSVQN